jgi:hypothetical protein
MLRLRIQGLPPTMIGPNIDSPARKKFLRLSCMHGKPQHVETDLLLDCAQNKADRMNIFLIGSMPVQVIVQDFQAYQDPQDHPEFHRNQRRRYR